jgi:hypothetical protein
MSISNFQKKRLNKMNEASRDVSLGTILQKVAQNSVMTGSAVVVTSSEASASTVIINTGLTGLIGEIVQVRRSGSTVITPGVPTSSGSSFANIKVVNTGSYLLVSSGCSASCIPLATGDIVSWIAF